MLEGRIDKLDKHFGAASRLVKMFFIEDESKLSQEQIDSKTDIYVYMEI